MKCPQLGARAPENHFPSTGLDALARLREAPIEKLGQRPAVDFSAALALNREIERRAFIGEFFIQTGSTIDVRRGQQKYAPRRRTLVEQLRQPVGLAASLAHRQVLAARMTEQSLRRLSAAVAEQRRNLRGFGARLGALPTL